MLDRICTGPDCDRRGGTSGLCRSHYKQWHLGKILTPLKVATKDMGRPAVCSAPDCERPHKARGYCKSHNEHLQKYGELRAVEPRNPGQVCVTEDCGREVVARGLCARHWVRARSLARYGLTEDTYGQMFDAQGGRCAICGGTNANGHALSIDHDHDCCPEGARSCGRCVRGLLCSRCNFAIGHMGDDPDRLRAAADYVEKSAILASVGSGS